MQLHMLVMWKWGRTEGTGAKITPFTGDGDQHMPYVVQSLIILFYHSVVKLEAALMIDDRSRMNVFEIKGWHAVMGECYFDQQINSLP